MKKFILTILIARVLPVHAAPPANHADFPLTAHVVYSANRSEPVAGPQRLDAIIDGKMIELSTYSAAPGVLQLGDYPARISSKNTAPKSWRPYDQWIVYELLLPDGKVRGYYMIGIGTQKTNESR